MALQDFFGTPIAYDPDADNLVINAEFTVHAVDDVALATPLPVTDPVSGAPITLRSSPIGVLPDFRVPGDPARVILKSGPFTTRVSSVYGAAQEAVTEALTDELSAHPAWPWAIVLGAYTPPPVENHAPSVVIDTGATVIADRDATLVWTATDADDDPLTFIVDWGDGTTGAATSPATHTYAADGTFTAIVTADDGNGGTGSAAREFIATSPGATSPYHLAVMEDSPLIYYPLDEAAQPAIDATGASTSSSGNWPSFGKVGIGDGDTAVEFAYTSTQRITTSISTQLNGLTTFTFECLYQPLDTAGTMFDRDDQALPGRSFRFSRAGSKFVFNHRAASLTVTTVNSYPNGFLYHVVAVHTGTNLAIYVNGVKDGEVATTAALATLASVPLTIGNSYAFTIPSTGYLAGVAVYTHALSPERISAHKTAAGIPA